MLNNLITKNITSEKENYFADLKPFLNQNELIDHLYSNIKNFNFDEFQINLELEIRKNLKEWWINPEKGILKEERLLTILFEYDTSWWGNREAVSYGINKWEDYKVYTTGLDMGNNYDFATEFYACPGLTLSYYDCFKILDDTAKVESKFGIDDYFELDGFEELCDYVKYLGLLKIHEVFKRLHEEKIFNEINRINKFMFLLGEHDMGQDSILIIEK